MGIKVLSIVTVNYNSGNDFKKTLNSIKSFLGFYSSIQYIVIDGCSDDNSGELIEGLVDGTIDAVASDHVPVDGDAKMQPFGPSQPGASAIDTLFALTLSLVHAGHISMSRAIETLSLSPATILDVPGGSLVPGSVADIILFRPDTAWIVKGANFTSASRITPFEGQPVQGVVDATYVDGKEIYRRG